MLNRGIAVLLIALTLVAGTLAPVCAEPSPRPQIAAEAPALPGACEISILIDLSGSFTKYLEPTRQQLQQAIQALRAGDTVVLAVFSNESCNILWKGTLEGPADQAALESIVKGFQVSLSGGTEPVQAVNRTISEMVRVQNDKAARRLFLFFSDGFPDAPEGGLRGVGAIEWDRIPADMELFLLSYANSRDTELVRELATKDLRYSVLSPQGTQAFIDRLAADLKSRPTVPAAPRAASRPVTVAPDVPHAPVLPLALGLGVAALAAAILLMARRRGFATAGGLHLSGSRSRPAQVPEQLQLFAEDGAGGRRRIAGPFALVSGLRLRIGNQGADVNLPGDDLVRAELEARRNGLFLRPGIGSTHPLRVNGKRLREVTEVRNGALIQLTPRWRLRVEIGRPAIHEAAG